METVTVHFVDGSKAVLSPDAVAKHGATSLVNSVLQTGYRLAEGKTVTIVPVQQIAKIVVETA